MAQMSSMANIIKDSANTCSKVARECSQSCSSDEESFVAMDGVYDAL